MLGCSIASSDESCTVHEKYAKATTWLVESGYLFHQTLRPHVYKASHPTHGQVIIKFASSLPGRYGLKQSAEFLHLHQSAYWPVVIDYGSARQIDWLITPYFDGQTLSSLSLSSLYASESDACESADKPEYVMDCLTTFWLNPLESAINELHRCGYVHGDIKPDNILIDQYSNIQLIDFSSIAPVGAQLDSLPFHFNSPGFTPKTKPHNPKYVTPKTDWLSVAATLSSLLKPSAQSSLLLPSRYQILLEQGF
ncbi:serine/threonine-protein kinase [Vibrio sp. 10N.261.55.A7]|uniref:protein kinase domain-containing protein n=1 Tax=Vibrio sp. 10N.261.55.A7 TaxID=1880851 RepID=UPI000C85C8C9|nr:serine/threonine-protein kinase [Vibrio sp. 10N.261.55.A7]PMJ92437.1 hypothetical protein BCU12_08270 [Vibrio sp. 10N.261.55.A7]